MSDILVKYQPPVVEYFDIRIDCAGMFHLIQTLRVAVKELEVDKSIADLLEAMEAQYGKSPDGDPQVDGEIAAA